MMKPTNLKQTPRTTKIHLIPEKVLNGLSVGSHTITLDTPMHLNAGDFAASHARVDDLGRTCIFDVIFAPMPMVVERISVTIKPN